MKILDKKELNEYLEKESFWMPKRLVDKVDYVSGIEPFDELLNGKLFTEINSSFILRFRQKGLQLQIMTGLKLNSVAILESDILSINLEGQKLLFEQKDKSIIGRAIVGGLILGPVGAIIGGMTGIGQKKVAADMPENLLSISFMEKGEEKIILLSCKNKNKPFVEIYFLNNYKNKFQITHVSNIKPIAKFENDNTKRMLELISMKEKGLLTDEEFSTLKSKLL